ncbi:hypothetical protein JB92DRAFT_2739917 [Gautieria morchelliformis]|nr:hypothetical protein JB92DRAFT_2739917 [Gautieria morchelliformis]
MPPSHAPFSRESPAERRDISMRRSEQYYIDDGNIVLFAEDVAFRVHKSQLARHSTTFQDMFAVATPLQSSETFDGLSVVRLSDKADEVLEFLQSLYGLP